MRVDTDNLLFISNAATAVNKTRQNLDDRVRKDNIKFVKIDGKVFFDKKVLEKEYPEDYHEL